MNYDHNPAYNIEPPTFSRAFMNEEEHQEEVTRGESEKSGPQMIIRHYSPKKGVQQQQPIPPPDSLCNI